MRISLALVSAAVCAKRKRIARSHPAPYKTAAPTSRCVRAQRSAPSNTHFAPRPSFQCRFSWETLSRYPADVGRAVNKTLTNGSVFGDGSNSQIQGRALASAVAAVGMDGIHGQSEQYPMILSRAESIEVVNRFNALARMESRLLRKMSNWTRKTGTRTPLVHGIVTGAQREFTAVGRPPLASLGRM